MAVQEEHGHRIQLEHQAIVVPLNDWNQVSRSATILDDTIFAPLPSISPEQQYSQFRAFLAESSNRPIWSGYARGFAFEREFQKTLLDLVARRLGSNELQDEPILLCGNAGTGKSTALGWLAYQVRQTQRYPVLFIGHRSRLPVRSDLEKFCKWAEDAGASATLIVWDGMVDQEQYYETAKELSGRGRKIVLVGSCYGEAQPKPNFIQAPAKLNHRSAYSSSAKTLPLDEETRFMRFIDELAPGLSKQLKCLKETEKDRFWVLLYRLLPEARSQLRNSLNNEVRFVEQAVVHSSVALPPRSTLALALLRRNLIREDQLVEISQTVGGEEVTTVQKLIRLVMVPGRFGLNIPIELVARAISQNPDQSSLTNLVDLMKQMKADII